MPPLDPQALAPVPAPFWFVELFKVLGFCLHLVPMNIWYAGTILAMLAYWRGGHARRFGVRLMSQLPVFIGYGVNFGIVPLLFVQVAYSKAFYPATILMAVFWFSVVALLTFAYYGAYVYSFTVRAGQPATGWKMLAGWVAATFFLVIGFLFANAFSLMGNVADWKALWQTHSVDGAATGLALNLADAAFWPRWLLMFGFALGTTAAWTVVDAHWLGRREGAEYQRWAEGFALKLFALSFAWSAVAGSWYIFGTWGDDVRQVMFRTPWVVVTLLAGAAPVVPLALLFWRGRQGGLSPWWAIGVAAAQVGLLVVNAIGRQVVQNVEVARLYRVADQPVNVQWSAVVAFLLSFVAAAALIAWMVAQIAKVPPARTV